MSGYLQRLSGALEPFVPLLIVLALSAIVLWGVDRGLRHHGKRLGAGQFGRTIVMLVLSGFALVVVVLVMPRGEDGISRNEMLGVLGLVLTAIIALASTSFVSNAMAGLMLRSVGSFRPGDFVKVGEQFGRVTERGLFHIEIQTEDRDLTTLPNLYLVTNPVTVVRYSGTIVSCSLSLGYDIPFAQVKPLLIEAASSAGLEDAFVQILELGDFSVKYRIAGFLPEVSHLVTARSNLRIQVLNTLSRAGIEIVSPTFMTQRILPDGRRIVPRPTPARPGRPAEPEKPPEDVIFDKAEEAASVERLRAESEKLASEIRELEGERHDLAGAERTRADREIDLRRRRLEFISAALDQAEQADDLDDNR